MNTSPGVRTLLIVEDDAVYRERLAVSFRRRGYNIRAADSLDEVKRLSHRQDWDAAVVDLRLGCENGLDVVHFLRSRTPGIRVLVLTGYGSIVTAVEAMKRGAIHYLTKPADALQIERKLYPEAPESNGGRSADSPMFQTPSLDHVEWEHIQRILSETGGNISETARRLGIERRTLQRKLQKFAPPS